QSRRCISNQTASHTLRAASRRKRTRAWTISHRFHLICATRRLLPLPRIFDSGITTLSGKCRSRPAVDSGTTELEVESDLGGQGTRSYVMRATEGREEVIERVFIGDVDAGQAEAPSVAVAGEEVVRAERHIKEAA